MAAIADELDRILKATKVHFDGDEIRARWNSLTRLARALERFERTVAKSSVLELVEANPQKHVRAGDLVWQGRLGYCVVTEAADRSEQVNASVLPLHSQGAKGTRVRANYLNPVAGLLGVDSIRQPLGDELEAVLREFIRSVESGTTVRSPAKGK